MDKIKHIIATRFLCSDGKFGEKVLSKEFLDMGFRLISSYLIPTLENQTNKSFELVIMVHPKLNLGVYKRRLLALSDKLNIQVVRYNKFDEYACEAAKEAENLIITRIDYDDLVWNKAVEDIQSRTGKAPLYIYGYNHGYMYVSGSKEAYALHQEYRGNGTMSVFQSCIIDARDAELIGLHPYKWNHTRPFEVLDILGIDRSKVLFERDLTSNALAWVRHENTMSGETPKGYFKTKVSLDKEEAKRVFGVAILE